MSAQVGTFLLLGASGDLSGRLLLPALGQLLEQEPERREIVLIGAGTEEWSQDEWQHRVHSSLTTAEIDEEVAAAILNATRYVRADVTKAEDLKGLLAAGPPAPAIYFALPPAVTVASCEALREVELPAGTVLALEKPFGTDAASAHALNRLLTQLVDEDHIQRVDHFLGRSTVLNLLGVRFANRLFEPLWNNQHIDSVTVVYDEQLTLENRARYYDRAGALADMIQSHLLQVMALIAMEPPASVDAVDLRAAKTAVLRATRPWRDDPVACQPAGALHRRGDRRSERAELRRRAGRRRLAEHGDVGRGGAGGGQLAVVGCAVPAPLRQGAGGTAQGDRHHLQAAAAPADGATRPGSAGSTPAGDGPGPDGLGDERQRTVRSVRARSGHARHEAESRPAPCVR